MATRKCKGQPIHAMAQGRPVSGLKSIGARQAKSAATRVNNPTMGALPWDQEREIEETASRSSDAPAATEKAPHSAKVQNRHRSKE